MKIEKWNSSKEYEQIVKNAEKYSEYKLQLSAVQEQERLDAPSPVTDTIINIIFKIQQIIKNHTK